MSKETIKDSNVLTKELLRIEKRSGTITPGAVVESARPEKSPLHRHFEWEDSKAAHEYRLWQARQMISIIKFRHEQMDSDVRMFSSVSLKKEVDGVERSFRVYMQTERALANEELRTQILDKAKAEARNWALKYKALVELSQLISLIETL